MTCPTHLCDISDVALSDICSMLDLLDLVELFNVGNALLTLKLTSPGVITHYSDFGVNGISVCPHHFYIPKLRGLKSVSISNLPLSLDKAQEIMWNLPISLTSIDLIGQNCLDACFVRENDRFLPFDFGSRCPNLCALSLRWPEYAMSRYSEKFEGTERRNSWLSLHLPLFPDSLTRICLNWPHWNTEFDLLPFSPSLLSLDLSFGALPNFSWIFSLPNLETLKLRSVIDCLFDIKNPLGDSLEAKHLKLRELCLSACSVQRFFEMSDRERDIEAIKDAISEALNALIPALPSLEVLSTGNLDRRINSLPNAGSLTSLSIGYTPGANYPHSLTKLKLHHSFWFDMPDSEIVQLPPNLTILRAEMLNLHHSQASLLPRNITMLEANLGEGELNPLNLPPSLTFLKDTYPEDMTNGQARTDFEIEAMKLPNLTRLHHSEEDFIRAPTFSASIDGSGWTNLPYALKIGDFSTIEKFTVIHFGSRKLVLKESISTEFPSNWSNFWNKVEDGDFDRGYRETSVESLEWLRRRGLCSRPRNSFQITSFYPCIEYGLDSGDVLAFFKWASPFITPSVWKKYSKYIQFYLGCISTNSIQVLDFLYSNGYLMGPQLEPDDSTLSSDEHKLPPGVDHTLTLTVAQGDMRTLEWLVNHGHQGYLDLETVLNRCDRTTEDQIATIEFLKSNRFTSASFCGIDGRRLTFSSNEFFKMVLDSLPPNFFEIIPWLDWVISLGMKHTIHENGVSLYLADLLVKKGLETGHTSSWFELAFWINEKQLPITYPSFCQLVAGVSQEVPDPPESHHFIYDRTKWNIVPLHSTLWNVLRTLLPFIKY